MVIDELIVIENGEQKFVDSADNKVIDIIRYNTGKNLYNADADTRFDLQEDGSYLSNQKIGVDALVQDLKGIYTISVSVKCPVGTNYRPRICYTDDTFTEKYIASTGEYIDFVTTSNGKDISKIVWDYSAGTTELQFKNFQIEEGSSATEYEPFGGRDYHFAKENTVTDGVCDNAVEEPIIDMQISGNSVQNGVPSPETPLEIQSVGDKTSNLFNINSTSYCARAEQNLLRIPKVENGVLYSSGKANNFEGAGLYFKIEKNTDYNFSFDLDFNDETEITRQIILFLFDEINNGIITSKKSIYLNGDKGNISKRFNSGECSYFTFFAYSTNQYGLAFTNIYLGKQEVYEPYGYKVPIEVSGKNLFNNKESVRNVYCYAEPLNNGIKVTSTSTSSTDAMNLYYHFGDYSEFVGKTVSFSAESVSNTDNKTIAGYLISNTGDYASNTIIKSSYFYLGDKTTITATIPANDTAKNLGIRLFLGTGIDQEFIIDNMQVEVSDKPTEYEPYIEPITTNIYLSEPLRGVGEYKDYIDYKNKKVVRNIYSKVCTGTEIVIYGSRAISITAINPTAVADANYLLCKSNYYSSSDWQGLYVKGYTSTNIDTQGIAIGGSNIRIVDMINFPNVDSDETQITAFKTWLAEQYANGTPLIIDYVLATPIEETINILEISTADGTSIFDIETTIEPSELKVNYWKQIMPEEVVEETDNITQTGSNILIISTGAEITQSGTNLTIGG